MAEHTAAAAAVAATKTPAPACYYMGFGSVGRLIAGYPSLALCRCCYAVCGKRLWLTCTCIHIYIHAAHGQTMDGKAAGLASSAVHTIPMIITSNGMGCKGDKLCVCVCVCCRLRTMVEGKKPLIPWSLFSVPYYTHDHHERGCKGHKLCVYVVDYALW